MRVLLILFSFVIFSSGRAQTSGVVEIYLLKGDGLKSGHGIQGDFSIEKKNVPEKPFIRNEEITSFDTSSFTITFKNEAATRIGRLKPELSRGIPFVLTVDREPVLCGYFLNVLTSFGCGGYALINFNSTKQKLIKGLPEYSYEDILEERRKDPILIQALKKTNRLR